MNQAPAFTSGASVTVAENSGGSIYQATATDPEGASVTFSISGGADAARFIIGATGQLNFSTPPNFDLPGDADGNNVYNVELAASDGQATSKLSLSVTVTNLKEGIFTRRVGTGFVSPVAISPVSDTIVLVAERSGAIYTFNPQNGTRELLFQIPNVGDPGVTAIAAAPTFVPHRNFFVMYTTASGRLVVNHYLGFSGGPIEQHALGPLINVPAAQYPGGGWLGYDAGGNLWIATADAGGVGDPMASAQDESSRLGKIIRARPTLNPDPFAGAAFIGDVPATLGKGLHQPNGGAFVAGGLLIPDRGQTFADEVSLLATSGSFANLGWPFKEGSRIVQGTPPAGLLDPVIEYARPSGAAVQGIVGGAVGGNAVPSLAGQYVFGDRSGLIFTVPLASLEIGRTLGAASIERRTLDFAPDAGAIEQPVALVGDSAGRLYILDADGELFRVDAG